MLHHERRNLVHGVELLQGEIKIDRAFAKNHLAAVGPGGRSSDLDIVVSRPLQSFWCREPQIVKEYVRIGPTETAVD